MCIDDDEVMQIGAEGEMVEPAREGVVVSDVCEVSVAEGVAGKNDAAACIGLRRKKGGV